MTASSNNPALRGAVAIVCIVAAGIVWSLAYAQRVLRSTNVMTPVLFDHGLSAIEPQAPAGWTNEWCGSCHQAEFEQWHNSKHAEAGLNANFEAQFLEATGGRAQWCLNCHAPANRGTFNHASMEPRDIDDLFVVKPYWLISGVDCLSCHVRDGQVLGMNVTFPGQAAHPMRESPELGTAEFCGGCHQFAHKPRQFPDSFRGRLQQASLIELIEQNRASGDTLRCHDCHLPAGNHTMPGGYDRELVRDALDLTLTASWQPELNAIQLVVTVTVQGVGHRVPGGEHFFRYLSIRTGLHDTSGNAVTPDKQSLGVPTAEPSARPLVLSELPHVEEIRKRLGNFERGTESGVPPTPDTRLNPNEARKFVYLVPLAQDDAGKSLKAITTLWYHVLDPEEAKGFHLPTEELSWELHRVTSEIVTGTKAVQETSVSR